MLLDVEEVGAAQVVVALVLAVVRLATWIVTSAVGVGSGSSLDGAACPETSRNWPRTLVTIEMAGDEADRGWARSIS